MPSFTRGALIVTCSRSRCNSRTTGSWCRCAIRACRAAVLALAGELDLSSAPELERALEEASAQAVERLILDLAELSFMDSTGVSVLIRAKQEAEARGGVIAVRAPNGQVRRLLGLVG